MSDVRLTVNNHYFVYDAQKGAINKQKHGISFEAAAFVFLDKLRLDFFLMISTVQLKKKDGSPLGL